MCYDDQKPHAPLNILLTGASGFLGRALLPRLLSRGDKVHTLGRTALQISDPGLTEWSADLSTGQLPHDFPWSEIDRVVHLAAAGVKASTRVWSKALQVNVLGTAALLDSIERLAHRRPPILITRTYYEDLVGDFPQLLENPYIATKWASYQIVEQWKRRNNWPVIAANVFQIYGPGDDLGNVLSYAAARLCAGETASFGGGSGLRDWLFVDDAAEALALLVNSEKFGIFDIGSGELHSLREMVETLANVAGVSPALLSFDPARDRNDAGIIAHAQRFAMGWRPRTSVNLGLRRLIASVV